MFRIQSFKILIFYTLSHFIFHHRIFYNTLFQKNTTLLSKDHYITLHFPENEPKVASIFEGSIPLTLSIGACFPENSTSCGEPNRLVYQYRYRLAEYDTTKRMLGYSVYKLDVYVSNERATASNAVQYRPLKCGTSLWLRYKQAFAVKDFVNYLKTNEYLSSDIMGNYLPFVSANNNILTSYSRCFSMNEKFVTRAGDAVVHLNLYIMQNPHINHMVQDDDNRTLRMLKIRFTYNTMTSVPYHGSTDKLVGIPYIVSCVAYDELQYVIDSEDFDAWTRQNIASCYLYQTARDTCCNLLRKTGSYDHILVNDIIMNSD
eukprot:943287_1